VIKRRHQNIMKQIQLALYTIRIEARKQNKKANDLYLDLDSFCETGDVFSFLVRIIKLLDKKPFKDPYDKTLINLSTFKSDEKSRLLFGMIDSGIYGQASRIMDSNTLKFVYSKEAEEADLLPFFFLASIPHGKNEGILILSRVGKDGVRRILEKMIVRLFRAVYPSFRMNFNPLIDGRIIKKIINNGIVQKIRFIKFQIPHDKIDGLDGGHQEMRIDSEFSLSAQRLPVLHRLLSAFNPGQDVKNLFEVKEMNGYDVLKVEVKSGKSLKTINLGNPSKVRNYIDISEHPDLVRDAKQNPTFDSIYKIALQELNEHSLLLYGE
jgi:hypothetical protein